MDGSGEAVKFVHTCPYVTEHFIFNYLFIYSLLRLALGIQIVQL